MSVLNQICADKQAHIRTMQSQMPLSALEPLIQEQSPTRGFKNKIEQKAQAGLPALIAEVKKASPSKGIIREDFDPVQIARIYESSGATCLSVLTDEPYFQGKDDYLKAVRANVALPVLRKDFMIDPYQIFESRALGADCILIIMAALSDSQAGELHAAALDLGMDVLIEVHDEAELERALPLASTAMIGVNNRNLGTLEVDINTSQRLYSMIPESAIKVAESGIYTHQELSTLYEAGYHAFLVGESLMRQDDIAAAVHTLMTG
ncbi:MAG: indole-3-glycerol phosphate synthase TrpC [Rhodospirillales bacterium]|nr:indole-3-glycerol phosphate synthase TrpC [Rhodospirillales bacterium]MCB9995632.1 indole-3-glycerol phosphate synthase TrpC [Rhodospirillales bacterium]